MDNGVELSVQPQVWVNDRATDAGAPFVGDVQEILLAMDADEFRQTAQEIFAGRGDLEALVTKSGLAETWLTGVRDRTYHASVHDFQFEDWLEHLGLDRDRALEMTDDDMAALRASVSPPARGI